MELEQDYQKARAIPQFRQPFLDNLDLGEYAEYVSRIKYTPSQTLLGRGIKNTSGMACAQSFNLIHWIFRPKGTKSLILVDERPFLYLKNPYDFLGILLYHEGEHAKQRFKNGRLDLKRRDFYEALAWINQFRKMGLENSPEYRDRTQAEALRRAKHF